MKALERAEKNQATDMTGSANNERKHQLVRFLEDVPEFVGFDGEGVGPFEKGEVANLENEVVEILEKDKKVEIIEED